MFSHLLRRSLLRICLSFAAAILAAIPITSSAQVCASPGLDGAATPSGIVNSYHPGSNSPAAGATSITVGSSGAGIRSNTRTLRAGDLIVIMQMQDSSAPANAGLYEYAHVASVAAGVITLRSPLQNAYFQTMNTTTRRNWQAIWVPQYSVATVSGAVTADRWTIDTTSGAATGGVVAMDVTGALSLSGSITVTGAGFRGAAGINGTANYPGGTATTANNPFTPTAVYGGQKGEGIQGTPPRVFNGTTTPVNYTTLLGQGYTLGAGGQAAIGNAGGGANDGLPASGNNQYNSGGGGGGNQGAGGQGGNSWNDGNTATAALNSGTTNNIGNLAGGKGGNAFTNSATRLLMGGGGGAGSANDGTGATSITTWPPTVSANAANGATGIIASSGAPGGGVVLLRAGSVTGSGTIDASGYRAYNKQTGGSTDTDGGGGGGAGGAVFFTAASGNGTGLTIRADGGVGGSTNYFNHGPGGGGGGGYIVTNLTAAALSVANASPGQDACCGGTAGNGSPKAWSATFGVTGATDTAGGTAPGATEGASCLPALNVGKITTTPLRITPAQTTAQYVIKIANPSTASGAAFGVSLTDIFPTPFGLVSTVSTAAYTVTGVGTRFNGASVVSVPNSSGVTPTLQLGTPGSRTNTFTVFPGGTVTFTVTVRINATTGTYQNSATIAFIDPTRSTGGNATATGAPAMPTVTPGGTYAAGGAVGGSNYASSSSTGEDVTLANGTASLQITKTNLVTQVFSGQTTSYTITVTNLSGVGAPGTVVKDPTATGLVCYQVACLANAQATCPAVVSIPLLQTPGLTIQGLNSGGSLTFRVTCSVTATGF